MSALVRLRQLSHKLADSSDLAELCNRRHVKYARERRDAAAGREAEVHRLRQALHESHDRCDAVAGENSVLVDELRRVTQDREAERATTAFLNMFHDMAVDVVSKQLNAFTSEIRAHLSPPPAGGDTLTPVFLESIRSTVKRCWECVTKIHDTVQVAQHQYARYVTSSGGHPSVAAIATTSSPQPFLWQTPDAQQPQHPSLFYSTATSQNAASPGQSGSSYLPSTVESLLLQLSNLCVLLDTNAAQITQARHSLTATVSACERRLLEDWNAMEGRITSAVTSKRRSPSVPPGNNPPPSSATPLSSLNRINRSAVQHVIHGVDAS